VLTVAAILAFLLNYRFSFLRETHHSGSGSHYRFARQFNALGFVGLILVPLVTDQTVQLLKGIPVETIQDNLERLDNWAS